MSTGNQTIDALGHPSSSARPWFSFLTLGFSSFGPLSPGFPLAGTILWVGKGPYVNTIMIKKKFKKIKI